MRIFLFQEPVKRILALTETCLVERDPASYNIVTVKPFGEVSVLLRPRRQRHRSERTAQELLILEPPAIIQLRLIWFQVFALICDADNPQVFTAEFIRGQIRKYSSTERYADVMLTQNAGNTPFLLSFSAKPRTGFRRVVLRSSPPVCVYRLAEIPC